MSLLYSKNREQDLINMIAAEVSIRPFLTPELMCRSTSVPRTSPSR